MDFNAFSTENNDFFALEMLVRIIVEILVRTLLLVIPPLKRCFFMSVA